MTESSAAFRSKAGGRSEGHELAAYGATAVAITPGWLRSEMMLENFGVTESNWRDAVDPAQLQSLELILKSVSLGTIALTAALVLARYQQALP